MTRDRRLPIAEIVDEATAFAFILGVLFNQQVQAERAWQAPYRIAERIGGSCPADFLKFSAREFAQLFAVPTAIHPFKEVMAANAYQAAAIVAASYGGDARAIWRDVTASVFVARLQALPGIGPHKAKVALFLATREMGIAVHADGGKYSIHACGRLAALYAPFHEPLLV